MGVSKIGGETVSPDFSRIVELLLDPKKRAICGIEMRDDLIYS